jgi:hypothetical protein
MTSIFVFNNDSHFHDAVLIKWKINNLSIKNSINQKCYIEENEPEKIFNKQSITTVKMISTWTKQNNCQDDINICFY